ncbi:hypothetical protein PV10_08410 [Exophiala mesophila]|uniref:Uncharacterized protein n=1 Tax=Exophiala mesophila TaxID=212818 RepID=A0A0D1WIS5_EXOME|nr:uncharacterized protein PV10_08410 [Exophiala mesophila]KIV88765.1 hypothetical protein PV10_08410 [Exophiala mesophila]
MEGIKNTVSSLVGQVGSIGYTGTNAENDSSSSTTAGNPGTSTHQQTTTEDAGITGHSADTTAGHGAGGLTSSSGPTSTDTTTATATNPGSGTGAETGAGAGAGAGPGPHSNTGATSTGPTSAGNETDHSQNHSKEHAHGHGLFHALGHKDHDDKSGETVKKVQSPDQGPDPALVGEAESHPKLSGQGVPGSHSAVFGLTPDGKRHDDTSHSTTTVAPAHSEETTMGRKSVAAASGVDKASTEGGVAGGAGGVSDQIDAPDMGKKGLERKDPLPSGLTGSSGKPGAGLTGV